jgi:hypothetical protein
MISRSSSFLVGVMLAAIPAWIALSDDPPRSRHETELQLCRGEIKIERWRGGETASCISSAGTGVFRLIDTPSGFVVEPVSEPERPRVSPNGREP